MSLSSDDVKQGILAAKAEAARRRLQAAQRAVLAAGKLQLASAAFSAATKKGYTLRPLNMTPIPLVTAEDDRPAVCDLITQHSDALAAVRSLVAVDSLYDPNRHDDLFLLRFVLSHTKKGGVTSAASAARATLRYRHEHGLDSQDIRREWPSPRYDWPAYRIFMTCVEPSSLSHTLPHPDRGVVSIVAMSGIDQAGMAATDAADTLASHRRWTEWCFQMVDDITRRTGRLTKTCRLIDMRGVRLRDMDRAYIARDGANAKTTEDFYPQLLAAAFLCHPPSWIQFLWRVCRPLFPQRFIEKIDLIAPQSNPAEARRIHKYAPPESIPVRFGGLMTAWPPPLGEENLR